MHARSSKKTTKRSVAQPKTKRRQERGCSGCWGISSSGQEGAVIAAVRLSGRFHTESKTETGNSTSSPPPPPPSTVLKSSLGELLGQRLYKSQERGPRRLTFSPDRLPLPRRPCAPCPWPLPRWLSSWCNCWPLCFRGFLLLLLVRQPLEMHKER